MTKHDGLIRGWPELGQSPWRWRDSGLPSGAVDLGSQLTPMAARLDQVDKLDVEPVVILSRVSEVESSR